MVTPEHLDRALDWAAQVLAGVRPEQLADPTPCEGWTVRDLVNHLVDGAGWVSRILAGERVDPTAPEPDVAGDDALGAFARQAAAARATWERPEALEREVDLGFATMPGRGALGLQTLEIAVHAWDLAKATGQGTAMDRELAEVLLGTAHGMLADAPRPDPGVPFAPEVEVAPNAPAPDRLVAYLGRRP